MKLQVFLLFCFLIAGGLANPSRQDDDKKESNDLQQLLSEFTDATLKWNFLYEKYEKIKLSDCQKSENIKLCREIDGKITEIQNGDMRILTRILSSLQEKIDKFERKMENGIGDGGITNRDLIQGMKALERRLQHFHGLIASMGKSSMKYIQEETEEEEEENGGERGFEEEKALRKLSISYRKLMNGIVRIEEMVKNCGQKNQFLSYKNINMKDVKDMLEDIAEDIKLLRRMSAREMNENEKILKKINKKLEKELKDDDKDDEELKRSLKRYMVEQRKALEKVIKKALAKDSDDDDDDDDSGKKDSDEEDESCDDSDGCDGKKSDTDDDDDDDDDTDDSDDDDDNGKSRKKNRENFTKIDERDVEVLRNSAFGGKNKFMTSLFGIPPYIEH